MTRAPATPPWMGDARLWCPRTKIGGVSWRIAMLGAVLPHEKIAELRFLVRLAFALGIAPGLILFLTDI